MSRLCWLLPLVFGLLVVPSLAEPVTQPIKLFNGKDLTNFYTWLKAHAKNKDPNQVFTVRDGMLRISGQEFGALTTEKEYEDYHLIAEFKWGEQTWAPRADRARDSGILLHCVGEDGAVGGVWMQSIECQMIEGGTGDILMVKGKGPGQVSMTARAVKRGKETYYDPNAEPKMFTNGPRIDWWGRSPEWKDVKGFRGKEDVERPLGEWNTLECFCQGSNLTYRLNGTVVNAATDAEPRRGKLQFQSEGAEVFFRRIELWPIKK
jgi:hypothetical protein